MINEWLGGPAGECGPGEWRDVDPWANNSINTRLHSVRCRLDSAAEPTTEPDRLNNL